MKNTTRMLEEEILRLELLLLHTDHRANPELAEELLSEGFEEINGSGRITGRAQVIEWLKSKKREDRWELSEFAINVLSIDLVRASYRAVKLGSAADASVGSRRSSVWKRTDNSWRMLFHQATKLSVDQPK